MNALIIANGAILILREALKVIDGQVKAGEISVESQVTLHKQIDAIRAGDFTGPEWDITPASSPPAVLPDPPPTVPPPVNPPS